MDNEVTKIVDAIMKEFNDQLLYPSDERKQRTRNGIEAVIKQALSERQENLATMAVAKDALEYAWERIYINVDGDCELKHPFHLDRIIPAYRKLTVAIGE